MNMVSLKPHAIFTIAITLAVIFAGCVNQSPSENNKPPIADFTISKNPVNEKENVVFDATNSKDPDGKISRYLWDFGDGGQGIGSLVSHVYNKGGNYTVVLTVIDDKGKENSKEISIKVNAIPKPIIDIEKTEIKVNENITLSAESSKDTDGTIKEYIWDFGDGTNATGVEVFHQYLQEGNYTITLMVKDDFGAVGEITVQVKVEKRKFKITWNETQNTAFENYTTLFLTTGQSINMQDNITNYNMTKIVFNLTWEDRYVNVNQQFYTPTPNDNISLFVKTPENLTDKQYSDSGYLNTTMFETLIPSDFEIKANSIEDVYAQLQIYNSEKGRGIWDATVTLEQANPNNGVPDFYEQVDVSVSYYYYSAVIEEI